MKKYNNFGGLTSYGAFKMKNYILIILTILLADKVLADSWASPKVKDYYNSDSTFYVYPPHLPHIFYL